MHTENANYARIIFARKGIDVATTSLELISELIYYPNKADLPIARHIYLNGIFIPCFPRLSDADRKCIEESIKNTLMRLELKISRIDKGLTLTGYNDIHSIILI